MTGAIEIKIPTYGKNYMVNELVYEEGRLVERFEFKFWGPTRHPGPPPSFN